MRPRPFRGVSAHVCTRDRLMRLSVCLSAYPSIRFCASMHTMTQPRRFAVAASTLQLMI